MKLLVVSAVSWVAWCVLCCVQSWQLCGQVPSGRLSRLWTTKEDADCGRAVQGRSVYALDYSLTLIPSQEDVSGLDRLQKGSHALRVRRFDVVGGGVCLHVLRAATKKMLCRLVITSAVRGVPRRQSHRRSGL